MSNKIGRFEIQSEIRKSCRGSVYKASDPESGQTVVLKTLTLEGLGDHRGALVESILEESDRSKAVNSHTSLCCMVRGRSKVCFARRWSMCRVIASPP